MEQSIAENIKSNPKRFWNHVNSTRKVRTGITNLMGLNGDDQQMAVKDNDKAEVLAKFSSSVFTNEPSGDLPEFDTRTGPDKIHPKVLKELRHFISTPLAEIFNRSLEDGKLPQKWKEANITAIYKKGSKSDPGHYRPVSLTNDTKLYRQIRNEEDVRILQEDLDKLQIW
ncbi:uncharacterized protein LOC117342559 [Pecten maximus]|uniref:uncharacterized protein LOC117342559 n=1 Tax=Pecten maximus TaxID=6579 RepID=UPI00145816DD|nr:uncharacterized protein LOC117342559 [Pecten maximus]